MTSYLRFLQDQAEAGGFLVEADKIVQPFHLPRFEHGTYQPSGETKKYEAGDDSRHREDVKIKLDVAGASIHRAFGPATEATKLSLNYQEEDSDEDDLEEVVPDSATNGQIGGNSQLGTGVPKSMLEHAAEMSTRNMGQELSPTASRSLTNGAQSKTGLAPADASTPAIALSNKTRAESFRSGQKGKSAQVGANRNQRHSARTSPRRPEKTTKARSSMTNARRRSERATRKNARGQDADSEESEEDKQGDEEESNLSEPPVSNEDGVDEQDDDDDGLTSVASDSVSASGGHPRKVNSAAPASMSSNSVSARKRKRSEPQSLAQPPPASTLANAPTTSSSTSTRVLRTRAPKSAEQLQAERDAELAYRRAIRAD